MTYAPDPPNFRDVLRAMNIPDPGEVEADPMVHRLSWRPAKQGGANFRTHRLTQAGPDRLVFRLTALAYGYVGIFALHGVAFGAAGIVLAIRTDESIPVDALLGTVLFSVLMFGGASLAIQRLRNAIVIDRRLGWAWRHRSGPDELPLWQVEADRAHFARLEDLRALQVVKKQPRSRFSRPYTSYELNAVRADGSRLNLTDHGSKRKTLEDARHLARFLKLPLWTDADLG